MKRLQSSSAGLQLQYKSVTFKTVFLCSVPAAKVSELCPDCPSHVAFDNAEVQKAVTLSLEKFNKESTLDKHFSLLKISRATTGVSFPHVQDIKGHTVSTQGQFAAKCFGVFLHLFIYLIVTNEEADRYVAMRCNHLSLPKVFWNFGVFDHSVEMNDSETVMTYAEVAHASSIKEQLNNNTTVCIVDCPVNPPRIFKIKLNAQLPSHRCQIRDVVAHIPLLTVHLFPCVCIQMAMRMYYNVEYTIQETTCPKSTEVVTAETCPPMNCEFAVSCAKLLQFQFPF